jgi:hypothetical protein
MPRVQHLVLLKFKPNVPADTVPRLFAGLEGLKRSVKGIVSFNGGAYSSPEGLNQGFSHGFAMIFSDVAARDAYLAHAEHEKVKAAFLPLVENVIAFDFEEKGA